MSLNAFPYTSQDTLTEPALSMARTLPSDLLYLVFLRALPSEFTFPNSPDNIWTIPPLNCALVCHAWRAAAFSHPSLWSSIRIVVYSFQNSPTLTAFSTNGCFYQPPHTLISIFISALPQTTHSSTNSSSWPLQNLEIAICVDSAASPYIGIPISVQCSPSLRSLKLALEERRGAADGPSCPAFLDLIFCTASVTQNSSTNRIALGEMALPSTNQRIAPSKSP